MGNFLMFALLILVFFLIFGAFGIALAVILNSESQTEPRFDEGYKEQARLARQQAHEGLRHWRSRELELAKGREG